MRVEVGQRLGTLALVHGLGYAAAFGWNVIAARVTSIQEYGVLTLAVSVILALQVLFEFGQQRSLVRFLSPLVHAGDDDAIRCLTRRAASLPLQAGALIMAALAACIILDREAVWGGLPAWQWLLVVPAGLGAAMLNIQAGAYIAAGRAVASSVLSLVLVPVVLCAAFAWQGRSGPVGIFPMFVATILAYVSGGAIATALLLRGKIGRRRAPTVGEAGQATVPDRRGYYGFAAKAFVVAVLSLGLAYADRYLLGAFATLAAVGLYNLPARTSRLLNLPVYFLNPLAGPAYTRANRGETLAEAMAVYRASARVIASVVLPVGLSGAVFAEPVLTLLGGEQFAPAAATMAVLVAGAIVLTLSGNSGLLLQMGGREDDEVRATTYGLIVNVVVALALLRPLGIVGVAAGTAAGYAVVAAARLLACWRRWRVALWDLLGLRQVLAVAVHLLAATLGHILRWPWPITAGAATVACALVCAPWSAIADLADAIARDDGPRRAQT